MAAPGIWDFGGPIADHYVIIGALAVAFAVIAMSEVARVVRFINIPFGLWLIAAPWILQAEGTTAIAVGMGAGALLIALCLRKGEITDRRG